MSNFVFTVATSDAMERFGERLASYLRAGDLVVLTGPLGAGKTTLTRGIGVGLGVRGSVTSPTFVVARTHPNSGSGPELVHVDAYRLVSAKELDDLDIDYTHSVVVVEWGKGMLDGVSESWLEVEIERAIGEKGRTELTGLEPVFSELSYDDEGRRVCIKAIGSRWDGNALRSLRALVDLSSCS